MLYKSIEESSRGAVSAPVIRNNGTNLEICIFELFSLKSNWVLCGTRVLVYSTIFLESCAFRSRILPIRLPGPQQTSHPKQTHLNFRPSICRLWQFESFMHLKTNHKNKFSAFLYTNLPSLPNSITITCSTDSHTHN